ncbi:hypothetical protein SDC9_153908 [bioreactor metagenome]|uniref:Uncharacterized protein n=1 Tax=bioreactor metagenome TaxID=1076179 RepID=A0A645EZH2_9ZZZZ
MDRCVVHVHDGLPGRLLVVAASDHEHRAPYAEQVA